MKKLVVVCTDRGQHERALLGSVRGNVGGLLVYLPDEGRRRTAQPQRPAGRMETRADGGLTLVVTCRRCRRVARVRDENLVKMLGVSLAELDISLLT